MVKLKNIPGLSALHHKAETNAPQPEGSKGIVSIRDTGLMDKINLRAQADNGVVQKTVKRVVGADIPTEANRFHQAGHRSIHWLGPDEWMILAENGGADDIIATLDTPEAGHVAVVNVSDALGALVLEGAHVRDVLAKHCAIDFHPRAFTQGMVVQSLLSHAGVVIACLDDSKFMVIGRTSFMPYILDLLTDAAVEYGYDYQAA